MHDTLSILFIATSTLFASSVILLALKNIYGRGWTRAIEASQVLICVALLLESMYAFGVAPVAYLSMAFVIISALILAVSVRLRSYSVTGIYFYGTNIALSIVGLAWGIAFLVSIDVSLTTRILLGVSIPLLFLSLPFGILHMIEQFDVLCRHVWRRPRASRARLPGYEPLVSLHVPVYAEPPEIVIGTLNSIADLRYGNYEVVVIDNNTKDEALWRPVESHCKQLGPKFKFFHVDTLPGAKAGALNLALEKTSAEAEIIGLVDSDYQAHPDFIADLIGHFEDPKIGFVQTPHDYREWEESTYLTMCYWEYKAFFHTILVALNERDAALTIGTMCLLRKKAVEEAGGWATWCLTEDSELSIRLHDLGYSSVYVPHTYGRGLIPETFWGYTKQRRRWIAGPVQEMKHHIGRFLGLGRGESKLTIAQRFHHLHHGWGSTLFGLNPPLIALLLLLALSMLAHREMVAVPQPLWLAVTVLFVANIVLQWLHYRVILQASIREMLLGMLAHKALSHAVNMSALSTAFDSNQHWHRTSKFPEPQTVLSSLAATRVEAAIGISLAASAVGIYALMPVPGLLTMCLIGVGYKSLDYLAAPVVAFISARSHLRNTISIDTSGARVL